MGAIRSILVIDDESAICDVVTGCFEDWPGTRVDCVMNGDEGLLRLRSCHYELAIIDGLLPGLSGLRLAELAVSENVPALLTTGHPDLINKLEAAGFPYLSKPFALDCLRHKAETAIADAKANVSRIRAALEAIKDRAEALATTPDTPQPRKAEAAKATETLTTK